MNFKNCPAYAEQRKERAEGYILQCFQEHDVDFMTIPALQALCREQYGFELQEIFDQALDRLVDRGLLFIKWIQPEGDPLWAPVGLVYSKAEK